MRTEEYTVIRDSLRFMTSEQLVGLEAHVRMNINKRLMRSDIEIENCEEQAARLRSDAEVLSGARIGDGVRRSLDRKHMPLVKPERLTAAELVEKLKAQGVKSGVSYRKSDFEARVEKADIGSLDRLIAVGIVVTSKGWCRFSDEAAGCIRIERR